MPDRLKKILATVLILLIGKMPVCWGHSHLGLSGEQLREHLALNHPGCTPSTAPAGWHFHVIGPGVAEHGSSRSGQANQYSSWKELVRSQADAINFCFSISARNLGNVTALYWYRAQHSQLVPMHSSEMPLVLQI